MVHRWVFVDTCCVQSALSYNLTHKMSITLNVYINHGAVKELLELKCRQNRPETEELVVLGLVLGFL